MRAGDEQFERLRGAIDRLAEDELETLIEEARAEARVKVRVMLAEAIAQAMLERAEQRIAPARARPAPAPAPAPPGPEGFYVYGVGRSGEAVPGVETVMSGGLAALVGRVPMSEFEDDALRENLADAEWLEATARRHEEVLEAAGADVTVVPMRLCTVYRDRAGVERMLERGRQGLTDALERLEGRIELGVKVFARTEPRGDGAETATGRDYLRARQADQARRRHLDESIDAACEAIHAALSALADESVVNPVQRSEVSGRAEEMVLNGAYLVRRDAVDAFEGELGRLSKHHADFDLELTGPWPPYNFVEERLEVGS